MYALGRTVMSSRTLWDDGNIFWETCAIEYLKCVQYNSKELVF